MGKSLQYFLIGIAIASILFSLYGIIYRGEKFMDALSGIIIGVALLGSLFFENNKKQK